MSQLFDPDTGEIREPGDACPHCAEARHKLVLLERDIQHVEKDLRDERREVARLKTELEKERTQSVEGRVAKALFDYWVRRLGKNPKTAVFGEKRQKCVTARLREHDPEYIARAIDGLAVSFYTSPNGKRFDDLELVCRDEVKLEGFYETAERVDAATLLGPAWRAEFGAVGNPT